MAAVTYADAAEVSTTVRRCEIALKCDQPGVRQVQTLMSTDLLMIGVERLEWCWACEKHAPMYELQPVVET